MNEWQWGLAALASPLAWAIGRRVYDDVYKRVIRLMGDKLRIEEFANRNKLDAVRTVEPNDRGRYPLLQGIDGTFRDPNSLRAFTLNAVLEQFPFLEAIEPRIRALEAAQGWPGSADTFLPEGHGIELASGATLGQIMTKYNHKPRLHSILIGEQVIDGQAAPLTLDVPNCVHIINTGGSGLGKSTLAEAIGIQLAGLPGVEMAAIDYGSGTFDRLEPAMKWKIAEEPREARAMLGALIEMCNERKANYKEVGRIRSLDQYNARTGQDLPFVVVMVDETPALLDKDVNTKEPFIQLARMGRKYGVGMVLSGTDFKAETLPSQARGNCQARIAFWLEHGLSMSLLNSPEASKIEGRVGQVVVKMPGVKGILHGQTPNVVESDYDGLALTGSPKPIDVKAVPIDDRVADVLQRHADGQTVTKIAREVFGHGTAHYIAKVRKIISNNNN